MIKFKHYGVRVNCHLRFLDFFLCTLMHMHVKEVKASYNMLELPIYKANLYCINFDFI